MGINQSDFQSKDEKHLYDYSFELLENKRGYPKSNFSGSFFL